MRIKTLKIDDKEVVLSNMIVIVGSNGTGKTRFLEELDYLFTERNKYSWYWNLQFEADITENDLSMWYASLITQMANNEPRWYSPFTKGVNQDGHDGLFLTENQYKEYSNKDKIDLLTQFAENEFIKEFTHYLPVASRLATPEEERIDEVSQKSSGVVNLLLRNIEISENINVELNRLFKKKIILALHNLPRLQLKMVDADTEPIPEYEILNRDKSYQDYLEWLTKNEVPDAIHLQGHGVQAFLHILLTHCIPLNHILLIDEPEIHLYPSVKRKFGNTLGLASQTDSKQFFCVTHDSDFLQGIIDSKCDATIIRIKKAGKGREIYFKSISSTEKYYAGQNQTPFLQIPFLDAVIIVEGATDRFVYEQIFYDNSLLSNVEYKFVSAGGKDSVLNPDWIANDLNVPRAIILDFENLKDKDNLHMMKLESVKASPGLIEELTNVGKELKGIPDLIKRGLDAISDSTLKTRVTELIARLKTLGIFIVHKGTLESWVNVEVEAKNQFPERFLEAYNKNRDGFSGLISYLKEIEAYLLNLQ